MGLRFGVIGADVHFDSTALQAFVDSAANAFQTFHALSANGVGTTCFLSWVTGARVGLDGKYLPAAQTTRRKDIVSPVAGHGTPALPFNSALVVSLRTALPRGYASNGRMYYPAIAVGVAAGTGRVLSSHTTPRANGAKALFDGLNVAAAAYATNMRLCVMSTVGSGLAATVTSVRVDDRTDSIERRESRIQSTWTTATLA